MGTGWSPGEEKVKALCGKGVGDKGALSILEGMGGEEGQHLYHAISLCPWPQARSWALSHGKSREAKRGFWEISGGENPAPEAPGCKQS